MARAAAGRPAEDVARVAPPKPRNLNPALNCIGVFGVVGVAWHFVWIVAGIFLVLALNDAAWNNNVWRKQYAAWNESYLCERCGWIGGPAVDNDHDARIASQRAEG